MEAKELSTQPTGPPRPAQDASELPRLDWFLDTHREKPATLLIEEESGLIVAELSASPTAQLFAAEMVKRFNGCESFLSWQAKQMLDELAECGLYGLTASEVAARFVDEKLISLLDSPCITTDIRERQRT